MKRKTLRKIKDNRFIRFIFYPYEQIRRKRKLRKFKTSEDSVFVKRLKCTHPKESCFIIGNGPSLTAKDLDKLNENGWFCFAANRIYRIFSKTAWRPSIYLSVDNDVNADDFDNIRRAGKYLKFLNYNSIRYGRFQSDNIHYLCVYEPFKIGRDTLSYDTLSDDPSIFSVKAATVTANAIELAVYMGFSTIYLLGVDNNYKHIRKMDGSIKVDQTMPSSYFAGGEPSKSLGPSIVSIEYMNETYEVAKCFAEEHGVKIINATRGGKLEVFERVDFDELMK